MLQATIPFDEIVAGATARLAVIENMFNKTTQGTRSAGNSAPDSRNTESRRSWWV
jgi:hypothetical protein